MPVRSRPFWLAQYLASQSWSDLYVCPPGRTAIVKEVRVHNPNGGVVRTNLAVWGASGAVVILRDVSHAAQSGYDSGPVEWILAPGDRLRIFVYGSGGAVELHTGGWGSLLSGVAA